MGFIMQFSPVASHFVIFRTKSPPSTAFLNTLSVCSSLKVTDQILNPQKKTVKITVSYILNFMNLYGRQMNLNPISANPPPPRI
jgi:hypothetical protein